MRSKPVLFTAVICLCVSNSLGAIFSVVPGQSVQSAINAASYGDTVHVFPGTYTENLTLKNGISLEGHDPKTTILDGWSSWRVITAEGCDPNTLISGFTIANGRDVYSMSSSTGYGLAGGLLCSDGALTISHCIFSDNCADYGGAIAVIASSVTVQDSQFISNSGQTGAVFAMASDLQIDKCRFIGNRSGVFGGALNSSDTNLTISNSVFLANQATDSGGAVRISNYGDLMHEHTLVNCIFAHNTSDFDGGAIAVDSADVLLVHCTIAQNQADYGGGISCWNDHSTNWTVVQLENCILWNNLAGHGSQIAIDPFNFDAIITLFVTHTDIQGGIQGIYMPSSSAGVWILDRGGNLDVNPVLVNPVGLDGIAGTADDDLRKRPWSPCIDAGAVSEFVEVQTDIDGKSRSLYDTVDMGADEVFPIAGDIDADGDVDLQDFNYFADNWLK